ncbi:MAG: YdeI/OmpD-associated family protein [Thermoanaerobaculia bacterium]
MKHSETPDPTFFETPEEFRRWLARHHASTDHLWVGFHKTKSGKPSMTWPQSVDEALCYGWIDGVRKSIDAERYTIRFTPRKKRSTWSLVNIRRVEELTRLGRMKPAGVAAFEARDEKKSGIYSFEQRQTATLTTEELKEIRKNERAWEFFSAQPLGYRKIAAFWIRSAKREETRARRLRTLIYDSAAGLRVGPLRRQPGPSSNSHKGKKTS